jgi:hypothetical protein
MRKLITIILVLIGLQSLAQNIPPQAINFQGVAIDKNGIPVPGMDELGNPIQNSAIRVRFSILTGTATGTISYQEEHLTTTDEFGRFNLEIGRGTATNGVFSAINWGGDKHFLQVEVDLSALGTNYTLASVQEFLSVPYALYAKTAGSTGDGDTDPTNEIQTLSLTGNLLEISMGNSVTLPPNTDSQTLSIVGGTLTISGGNSVTIPDAQTLSLNGTALSISNGNSVNLPANTDNQTLSLAGNNLSILNGNSVTLPGSLDNDTLNEIQDLYLDTLGYLRLTMSNVAVLLPKGQTTIGAPTKNIATSNYCFYPRNLINSDSINASVAYEDDTLIVLYYGNVTGTNFKAKFFKVDKLTNTILSTQIMTSSTLQTAGSGQWYLYGFYRPGRYIIQLGESTNIYSETGVLIYGTNSPYKGSAGFTMGDSLMFSWSRSNASSTSHFSRMNIYTNSYSSTSIQLCSQCYINFNAKASGDDLLMTRSDICTPTVWRKGASQSTGIANVGQMVKIGNSVYGVGWTGSQCWMQFLSLDSTLSNSQTIFPITGGPAAVGNSGDTAVRVVFETSTSQIIGYQSINIPDPTKTFLVELLYVPSTGKMTIVDITLVEGSRTYYTDGRTGKLSMKYQATTCLNGALGQSVNKIYPFDF